MNPFLAYLQVRAGPWHSAVSRRLECSTRNSCLPVPTLSCCFLGHCPPCCLGITRAPDIKHLEFAFLPRMRPKFFCRYVSPFVLLLFPAISALLQVKPLPPPWGEGVADSAETFYVFYQPQILVLRCAQPEKSLQMLL